MNGSLCDKHGKFYVLTRIRGEENCVKSGFLQVFRLMVIQKRKRLQQCIVF